MLLRMENGNIIEINRLDFLKCLNQKCNALKVVSKL